VTSGRTSSLSLSYTPRGLDQLKISYSKTFGLEEAIPITKRYRKESTLTVSRRFLLELFQSVEVEEM